MCEFFILSSKKRHVMKEFDIMDDFSNSAFGNLLACKFAVESVNGI